MVDLSVNRKSLSQKKFRPSFDRLEDRLAPAVITVSTVTDVDDGDLTHSTISLRDAIKYSASGDTVQFKASIDGAPLPSAAPWTSAMT